MVEKYMFKLKLTILKSSKLKGREVKAHVVLQA